ncbi:MAG: MBL fold metallo-hydrolase [Candidatus Micrarchaeia archaeon]
MFRKIADGTFMLRTDERVCGTVYLIEEEGKRLIIDSGDGGLELGFVPDICILTHGHFDHSKGVDDGWKEVLLHPAEFDFAGPHLYIPKNARKNPMKPLAFGSHGLEFLHTPGHTDGSVCVFDRKTRALFSGDTKFADGGWGRTDLGGSDAEMKRSLGLIDGIGYSLLCPGHGGIEKRK